MQPQQYSEIFVGSLFQVKFGKCEIPQAVSMMTGWLEIESVNISNETKCILWILKNKGTMIEYSKHVWCKLIKILLSQVEYFCYDEMKEKGVKFHLTNIKQK